MADNNVPSPETPQESQQSAEELLLIRLRYKEGRLVTTAGNKPLLLDGAGMVWVVYTGQVDIFVAPVENGQVVGTRTFLFRVEAGQAIFGMDVAVSQAGIGLLAVGVREAQLIRLQRPRLHALAQEATLSEPVAGLVERWVDDLSASTAVEVHRKANRFLSGDDVISLAEEAIVSPPRGVRWIKPLTATARFMGRTDIPPLEDNGFLPLAGSAWLHISRAGDLMSLDTPTYFAQDADWQGLDSFHRLVLDVLARNRQVQQTAAKTLFQERIAARQTRLSATLTRLVSILTPTIDEFAVDLPDDALFQACYLVGRAQEITMQPPPDHRAGRPASVALAGIAQASRVRMRRVALRDNWWQKDSGPLLAFLEREQTELSLDDQAEEGREPVALLPVGGRYYEMVDPATQTRQRVTQDLADSLHPFAYSFYRPLPEQALGGRDLLRFGLHTVRKDLRWVGLLGLTVGLLDLVPPKLIELLFDNVIPGADLGQLWQLSLGLVAVAIGAATFQLTRSFVLLRIEGRLDGVVQAAVWDRLLRLPVNFFRQYTAGDLADRANGISAIRQVLTGAAITSILSGTFSLLNFLLLFYYSWQLALVAVGLTLVAMAALGLAGYFQVYYQRRLTEQQGKIAGKMLQLISAISKFRIAGNESQAFNEWANNFVAQRQVSYLAERVSNYLVTFNASYPIITSMMIFTMFIYLISDNQSATLTLGAFLAFNAAFGQFLSAALSLANTAVTVVSIVPLYERTTPILQTAPEVQQDKADPGELTGHIEISQMSFRYAGDGPLVLKDVSMKIKPREFVAFVGPSGAGKSTMLRLLLGFEMPVGGSIYFDGQELSSLDIQAVRRQIGTVLQNGQLLSGSIFSNIVGAFRLSIDDAWEAARQAGLDEDIKQMPMGMHTMVSEGAGTFSGGQRQRMLIARAIVNRPRIIIFDEATSALDNKTQAIVSQSMENLQATRIVIAHRLSTVINADRIFVFDQGQVVQVGPYRELINQPGLFAELAQRQLA